MEDYLITLFKPVFPKWSPGPSGIHKAYKGHVLFLDLKFFSFQE